MRIVKIITLFCFAVLPLQAINLSDIQQPYGVAAIRANDTAGSSSSVDSNAPVSIVLSEQPAPVDSEDDYFVCPKTASEYFTRILDIDFESGTTVCAIYEGGFTSNRFIGQVSRRNPYAAVHYSKAVSPGVYENQFNGYDAVEKDIKDSSERVYQAYADTGSDKFLTMSRFWTAIFSFNGDIVDIDKSIQENKAQPKHGYTIYPADVRREITESWLDKVSYTMPWVDEAERKKEVELASIKSEELQSLTAMSITQKASGFLSYFARAGDLLGEIWDGLLATMGLFGLIIQGIEGATRKLQDLNIYDNYIEKGVFAVFALIMFSTQSMLETKEDSAGNEFKLELSRALGIAHTGFEFGDYAATGFTKIMANVHLSDLSKKHGIYAPITIKNALQEKDILENKIQPKLEEYIGACYAMYDAEVFGGTFPTQEMMYPGKDLLPIANYHTGYRPSTQTVNNTIEYDVLQGNTMSLSGCAAVLRQFDMNKIEIRKYNELIEKSKVSLADDKLKTKISMMAQMQSQVVAELGWFAAPLIGAVTVMADLVDFSSMDDELQKFADDRIEETKKIIASRDEQIGIDTEEGIFTEYIIANTVGILPYKLMPGFDSVEDACELLIDSSGGLLMNVLPIGRITAKINKAMAHKQVKSTSLHGRITNSVMQVNPFGEAATDAAKKAAEIAKKMAAFWLANYFYDLFLEHIGIILVAVIGLAQIVNWIIRVAIFTFIMPFIVIWSLTQRSIDQIITFMATGLQLVFKPVLIVISIFLALFSYHFMIDFGSTIAIQQIDMLRFTNSMEDTFFGFDTLDIDYVQRYILIEYFNGLLQLLIKASAVIVVTVIMLLGSTIMLRIMGVREPEEGLENMAQSMQNRLGRYMDPI